MERITGCREVRRNRAERGSKRSPLLRLTKHAAGFLAQHGPQEVNMDGVPCLLRAPELVVHHRSLGLTLMPRRQNRLVPQYALEGGEVRGGVAERVLSHLGRGHERRPLPRPVLSIRPQKPAHILVHSLHLPITLEVRLIETPRRSMNSFQTLDVNWGPRSDTI